MGRSVPEFNGLGRGLYPIIDADACERRGLDPAQAALALLDAGPPLVQLRAKDRPSGQVRKWAERIAQGIPEGGTRFIINDWADIAQSVGAHGVHVGQTDLPARELIEHFPTLLVGLSTHDEAQLREALKLSGLTYVALGPIFPTKSKKNAEPALSLERLKSVYELTRKRGLPLVAIGGISEARLPQVSEACDLVAVISLLEPEISQPNPYSWMRDRCDVLDQIVKTAR